MNQQRRSKMHDSEPPGRIGHRVIDEGENRKKCRHHQEVKVSIRSDSRRRKKQPHGIRRLGTFTPFHEKKTDNNEVCVQRIKCIAERNQNQNEELYYFDEKGIYPCRVKEGGW